MPPSFCALFRSVALPGLALLSLTTAHAVTDGYYHSGAYESLRFTNATVGATALYAEGFYGQRTVIANVEAGHVWGGHEVFDRSNLPFLAPAPSLRIHGTELIGGTPALGQDSDHATMVAAVLAGSGYRPDTDDYDPKQMGIAPQAELWSGAIATSFNAGGRFSLTAGSFLKPYKAFFNGVEGRKADVINSSIGFTDRAGTGFTTMIVDALSRQNRTVALVMSSGNAGPGTANGMATGYNVISVGSVSGERLPNGRFALSDFSSYDAADFFNPETEETIAHARANIHLVAPGENFTLPLYQGATGGNPGPAPDPLPTDSYEENIDGTSFAAPTVAGSIALLKDISYSNTVAGLNTENARDTRVIRSVLMAGAEATEGWNNGQQLVGGILSTSQGLDYSTGAGALDVAASAAVYREGTVDVAGSGGGSIAHTGWDFGSVANGGANDYVFENPFAESITLTVSLNWFIGRVFDDESNGYDDGAFVDLNLEVWSLAEGAFMEQIASSHSPYNTSEFLRFNLAAGGEYGLRVTFAGVVYNLDDDPIVAEEYGLAWRVEPVPEPGSVLLILLGAAGGIALARRRRNAA